MLQEKGLGGEGKLSSIDFVSMKWVAKNTNKALRYFSVKQLNQLYLQTAIQVNNKIVRMIPVNCTNISTSSSSSFAQLESRMDDEGNDFWRGPISESTSQFSRCPDHDENESESETFNSVH